MLAAVWTMGCGEPSPRGGEVGPDPASEPAAPQPDPATGEAAPWAPTVPASAQSEVVVDSASVDLEEGDVARVETWVTAERSPDGEILWEDGHQWRVLVRAGDTVHRLFDAFVPFGTVDFWVLEGVDGERPGIAILVDGGASVSFEAWIYEGADRAFRKAGSLGLVGRVLSRPR